ncbi:MotA/TolQ/ExbB proton channel family [Thiobacillus denitrificans ATCC 25259]|uniref:Tol-Pal system protein TolQ n=1 Tax=Thiobacillus denitrificans (strain ATCC 25259 / T1) TaxID=292415 RepID=Q3SET2_THIDA|nr:protein TolQ [Thiobacillus denitrificans]AAZ98162.1 MotA/TolQ/ExbB proton channel family [Thiobacillus denitrificans ATCC 25259]
MNPDISQDLSLLHLILNASLPVQIVMLLLLGASLMSWWYIFIKMFALKRALRVTDRFEHEFWGGGDIHAMYERVAAGREEASEMERIFEAGFREFMKLRQQAGLSLNVIIDGTRRAMRASYQRELDALESHLAFLATVGSVSPYVGLFGTVWGIMLAFQGLATVAQATLAQVAPGIAEALIATAMGLFAAIPAVVGYNRYTHDVDRLANRMESFMEEFSNILQRQVTQRPA